MTTIEISKELYEQLETLAQDENRSVDEIVRRSVKAYLSTRDGADKPDAEISQNPLLMIARAAEALGDASKDGDLAERSREILESQFPEYLMNRLRTQDAEPDEKQRSSESS